MHLEVTDARRLLELVSDLAALDGPEPFPREVVERVADLMACPEAVYFEQGPTPLVVKVGLRFPPRVHEAIRAYGNQRPTAAERLSPADGAVALTNLLSRRELLRLPFYQEAMRPIGVHDELMLPVAAPVVSGFSLIRTEPFTERDRLVLDLLAPHLARRRERAAATGRLVGANVDLTRREWDVLACVATGRTNKEIASILLVSPNTVRKHLENVFAKLGVHTRTAAVARAFRSIGG